MENVRLWSRSWKFFKIVAVIGLKMSQFEGYIHVGDGSATDVRANIRFHDAFGLLVTDLSVFAVNIISTLA